MANANSLALASLATDHHHHQQQQQPLPTMVDHLDLGIHDQQLLQQCQQQQQMVTLLQSAVSPQTTSVISAVGQV
jgi:hypothetical protein